MKNIYGTIGYTLLEHNKDKNKVIVLADMHDTLPSCNSKVDIAEWFKSKFSSSEILLEEMFETTVSETFCSIRTEVTGELGDPAAEILVEEEEE